MNQNILTTLQIILAFGNLMIMLWALKNFLKKPQEDLKSLIQKHDDEIKEMKASFDQKIADMEVSLQRGNDRFKKQYKAMEVIINSVFALLEFEVHYCESEQKPISKNLEKAKDDLHAYLAKMNSAE